ncbi:MAG: type II CAAX endopeptidase family protein [Gemmatimonadota bacterium]
MTLAAVPARPSALRATGWALLYLGSGFVLMVVLTILGAKLTGGFDSASSGPRLLVIQTISGLLAFGLGTWAIGRRGIGLSWEELRWAPVAGAGRGFALGLLLGSIPAALALGLSLLVGGAHFVPDVGSGQDYLVQVVRTGLLLAPAALLEEVMFRGVGQVVLARSIGRIPALLLLSSLFAMAHLRNPNGTTLGLINIALAGVLLGVAFYAPGGIWTAWGAHLGWNATLAALDAPVSGLPFRIPLIDYQPGGPQWLTGGTFGPEGGLLATATIALATVAAWRWSGKELS